MRRKHLKEYLAILVKEYEDKTYEDWKKTSLPDFYEKTFMGKDVQVHIDLLESEPDYLNIGFSVCSGVLSTYFPVGTNIIVEKNKK